VTHPDEVRAAIRDALAGCDTDLAVAAIAQMRQTHPGWADRIEREAIANGMGKMRGQVGAS
jgi:hypothetical protein